MILLQSHIFYLYRDGYPIIYELGPAVLTGSDIDDALAVYPQNEWIVQLNFKDGSANKFTELTKELASTLESKEN
jgi:preprotein translocase subunit SecD